MPPPKAFCSGFQFRRVVGIEKTNFFSDNEGDENSDGERTIQGYKRSKGSDRRRSCGLYPLGPPLSKGTIAERYNESNLRHPAQIPGESCHEGITMPLLNIVSQPTNSRGGAKASKALSRYMISFSIFSMCLIANGVPGV